VNDYGKHQNDKAQQDDQAHELIEQLNLLKTVDRRITPEHVAGRFRELLGDTGDGAPPTPSADEPLRSVVNLSDHGGHFAGLRRRYETERCLDPIDLIGSMEATITAARGAAAEITADAQLKAEAAADDLRRVREEVVAAQQQAQEALETGRQEAEKIVATTRDEALNQATEMIREAKEQAERIIGDARTAAEQAAEMIREAKEQVERILGDARTAAEQAAEMIDEAQARAGQILSAPSRSATPSLREPLPATGLSHYRTIVALDIERSTSRPDPVKAELRNKIYELFEEALCTAGIYKRQRDRFIDRGDGLLALIHSAAQVPDALLLNRMVPSLRQLLADYNASVPQHSQPQRRLRFRVVMHAGEVHYDANGCFGEALDVAFRLLDSAWAKRAFREMADPLTLVVSEEIYSSVVRHGCDGIDHEAFDQLVRVQVGGKRHSGWIHLPDETRSTVTRMASYRRPA
jgi:vacuolar-type H+-ATPase subunit H